MTSNQNLQTASDNSTTTSSRPELTPTTGFVSALTGETHVSADTNRGGGDFGCTNRGGGDFGGRCIQSGPKAGPVDPTVRRFRIGGVAVGLAALLISACGATTSAPSAGAAAQPTIGGEGAPIDTGAVPTTSAPTPPDSSVPPPDPAPITPPPPATAPPPPATAPPTVPPPPPPTGPPATAPPTVPPDPPPPPPTTTPPTTQPSQPVTVDLFGETSFREDVRAADGAGGSGEARQAGSNVVGVRSFAWHGYNGSGFAAATLSREFDATEMFETYGENVSAINVELNFAISGSGVLQGPYDRSSTVSVTAYVQGETVELFEQTKAGDDNNPIATPSFDIGASRILSLTREDPVAYFSVVAACESSSGAQAFSLLRESYCDFYEAGSVELTLLQATLTPGS